MTDAISIPAPGRQVNQYDKVLRENMEVALPGLIRKLLHIHAEGMEELPDDIQHTKERKPDVLKRIIDKNGQTFVLHIEFQRTDEREMVYRMAEYYIMLLRKYKLPVRQYVIYIGEGVPSLMSDHISSEEMHFFYRLIHLSTIDYRTLLNADNPEEKILAVLGNFGNNDLRRAVETIVNEVISTSKSEFSTMRYMQQLRILSRLRTFDKEIITAMESLMSLLMENTVEDFLYLYGERKGMEKGIAKAQKEKNREFVQSLLLNTNHSVREIANLVKVSEAMVRRMKRKLAA